MTFLLRAGRAGEVAQTLSQQTWPHPSWLPGCTWRTHSSGTWTSMLIRVPSAPPPQLCLANTEWKNPHLPPVRSHKSRNASLSAWAGTPTRWQMLARLTVATPRRLNNFTVVAHTNGLINKAQSDAMFLYDDGLVKCINAPAGWSCLERATVHFH